MMENDEKRLDVLFTVNKEYIDILLASIYSFISNGNLKKIRIHVISENFDLNDYHQIETFITNFDNTEIYFYPIENYNIEKYNIPDWHGTQISNARLFFKDILKPDNMKIQNLLYLDADTITVGDLNDIKNYTMGVHAVKDATCLKHYYQNLDGLTTYFNSGVIYFDVDTWLNKNYQDEIIKLLKENRLPLTYPDQDIFNCALKDHIRELPIKYNIPPHAYLFDGKVGELYFNPQFHNVSAPEIREALSNPRIIHSYGLSGIKPWQTNFNPYHDEYMKYIYSVNPNFSIKELEGLKKILTKFPTIFKSLLIARTYMNEPIEKYVRKLSLKCHNPNKKY